MTSPRPPVPDAFGVHVERLTYGPDALAHYERCVVFVPLAAPGDRVEVAVEERHRGWVRARVTRLVTPGPSRVTPFCPVFGTCGGCQWQHVAGEAQRTAKRALVAEQLARLGGLRDVAVQPIEAAGERAYRARITLAVRGRRLGYRRLRSHALVEVAACPIAAPAVSAAIPAVADWIAGAAPALEDVTIAAGPRGVVLVGTLAGPLDGAAEAAAAAWLAGTPGMQGVVLRAGRVRRVLGDPCVHLPLEADLHLEVPADAFSQVNPALNPRLVAAVCAAAEVSPGGHALDLYCGAGNFALPLARRGARVAAIDSAPLAIEAGRANAARMGIDGVTFACGDVPRLLDERPDNPLDAAILDPPRQGAAAALGPLVERRPARIVYVSCDPATLARDARTLVAAGYRLASVQPFDLFPQTHHVETVATFRLT